MNKSNFHADEVGVNKLDEMHLIVFHLDSMKNKYSPEVVISRTSAVILC